MLEFAAIVVLSAIALTFLSDATSGAMKLVRAKGRRNNIRVADAELTQ